MAQRFAVGTGAWTTANTGIWATSSGGTTGASVPTAADEVIFDANTGTITISAANTVPMRSFTSTGTNTLAFAATTSIMNIGDATAGAGNVSLSVGPSTTITLTGVGTINLVSTSATQQTITTNGKLLPNMNIGGTGSSYVLGDALNWSPSGVVVFNVGTFDTANFAMAGGTFSTGGTGTRTLTLGSSSIALTAQWSASNNTQLTMTSNTATVTISNNGTGYNNFVVLANKNMNGLSFVFTGGGQAGFSTGGGGASVNNLMYTGTAVKTGGIRFSDVLTVTGTLSVVGNSAINRVLLLSNTRGSARTLTVATLGTMTSVDFMDITAAGASSPWNLSSITGNSGDAGGNSNITFTNSATQTSTGTASLTWSTHSWTTRVPLPQDDVVVPNAFVAGRQITLDMPRSGRNIDMSTATGNPSISIAATEAYGSIALPVGAVSVSAGNTWTLAGRSSYTTTLNGVSLVWNVTIDAPGGTYALQDALTTTQSVNVNTGAFNTNSMTLTSSSFTSTGTNVRSLIYGASTHNITGTSGTNWNVVATGLTASLTASTVVIVSASASVRTFAGGDQIYGTLAYTLSGSTGQLSITGSNTFNGGINFSDSVNARTLGFTGGTTQTFGPNASINGVVGTSGKAMSIISNTAGTQVFLSKPSGGPIATTTDYLSVKDISAVQPLSFFAGANSTDATGNNGVYFAAAGTYRIRQSLASASVTSTSIINTPAQTPAPGNLLVAYYYSNGSTGSITAPSGWSIAVGPVTQGGVLYIFYKVSNGSETSVTVSQVNSRALFLTVSEYSGFVGIPTLDVTDSNSTTSSVVSLSTTASTGPTNTAQPALAFAMWGNPSTMAATQSITNNFIEDKTLTNSGSNYKGAVKELTGTAAVDSTLTWLTSRANETAGLVVFKDVAAGAGTFFTLFSGF